MNPKCNALIQRVLVLPDGTSARTLVDLIQRIDALDPSFGVHIDQVSDPNRRFLVVGNRRFSMQLRCDPRGDGDWKDDTDNPIARIRPLLQSHFDLQERRSHIEAFMLRKMERGESWPGYDDAVKEFSLDHPWVRKQDIVDFVQARHCDKEINDWFDRQQMLGLSNWDDLGRSIAVDDRDEFDDG